MASKPAARRCSDRAKNEASEHAYSVVVTFTDRDFRPKGTSLVVVLAPDIHDAHLIAAQMVACRGYIPVQTKDGPSTT